MSDCTALCLSCTGSCKQVAFAKVIECPKYDYNGSKLPPAPAQATSEYRELSAYEKGAIKKLVTSLCANYQGEYNVCVLLDTACPMLLMHDYRQGKLCKYFQNAVLPTDTRLEISLNGRAGNTKPCGVCGKHFALAGRKQYCSDSCADTARKKANKLRARKYRKTSG